MQEKWEKIIFFFGEQKTNMAVGLLSMEKEKNAGKENVWQKGNFFYVWGKITCLFNVFLFSKGAFWNIIEKFSRKMTLQIHLHPSKSEWHECSLFVVRKIIFFIHQNRLKVFCSSTPCGTWWQKYRSWYLIVISLSTL